MVDEILQNYKPNYNSLYNTTENSITSNNKLKINKKKNDFEFCFDPQTGMIFGGVKIKEMINTMYDSKMVKEDDEEESDLKTPGVIGFEGIPYISFFELCQIYI